MNIRKMRDRVFEIIQMEEAPEYLTIMSNFFLNTLDHLQGSMSLEDYRTVFEESCVSLAKEKAGYRMAGSLDSLLAAAYYYKQTLTSSWWQRKTMKMRFNLLLFESYDLLIDRLMKETGEELEPVLDHSTLFDELALSCNHDTFSLKEMDSACCWMLSKLRECRLLKLESHLECALMSKSEMIFYNRYPVVKRLVTLGIIFCFIQLILLLIAIIRIAYNVCVELPILRLMCLADKPYAYKIGEIEALCDSFIENGFSEFRLHILFFCIVLLFVFGIEYVAETWGRKRIRCANK